MCAVLLAGWAAITAGLAALALVYGVAYWLGGEIGAVITIGALVLGGMAYAMASCQPEEE